MSSEQTRQITDVFKWIAYGAIAISAFIISNTYLDIRQDIKNISNKIESIELKVVRMEYELKLRPNE